MSGDDLKSLLQNDTITLEILGIKKKGLLKKYVEYNITSSRFKSQVCRRYNDFYTLYEHLINRYPNRLVPRLPPAKINAMFNGVDSGFVEERRKALKRWLILISSHSILSEDPAYKFFLTYMKSAEHAAKLKEEFGHIPDEYITNPMASDCRITYEMTSKVNASRLQLDAIGISTNELANFLLNSIGRKGLEADQIQRISQDLKTLTNESYFPGKDTVELIHLREVIPEVTKSLQDIAERKRKYIDETQAKVLDTIDLVQDIMSSYKDLCQRKDKNTAADHQKAIQKIATIKKEKLSGVPNLEVEEGSPETSKQEKIFNDIDQREAFIVNCLTEENGRIFKFIDLLGNILAELSRIESAELREATKDWLKIRDTTRKFAGISI